MKKYMELYTYFQALIESGDIKDGEKLPSLRKAAVLFSVSVTTVQNAYFELQADGYIIAGSRSGYYARSITKTETQTTGGDTDAAAIRYDLKSGSADRDAFDITLWQRYIRSALRKNERLLSYSEPSGEADLREALCLYIQNKRNIITSPNQIVVGAGIQPLLCILACLMKDKARTVSFPDSSFVQGRHLLSSFGYSVTTRNKNADIIYVSPSHMTSYGDVMPIKRRLELIQYSAEQGSLVIEDDFDSDFVYNKPVPSLHTLSHGDNVVYMGSFSNVLIPGIHISFMVLTQELTAAFHQAENCFAQTASKTEQIALCEYIRDGHIRSQTRKVKRMYTAKTKRFYDVLCAALPHCRAQISENGLQIKLSAPFRGETAYFENAGIAIYVKEYKDGIIKLVLTPSELPADAIPDAVDALKNVLTSHERYANGTVAVSAS